MEIRQATVKDLPAIAQLERLHLNAELATNSEDFIGQCFSQDDLKSFLDMGWIVIAQAGNNIVGYVICADWQAFIHWPIYIKILKQLTINNPELNQIKSCQYGPVWIDKHYRGQGIFEQLTHAVKVLSLQRYQKVITFIAEENQHSYFAHTKKANMTVFGFVAFENRGYYLLSL